MALAPYQIMSWDFTREMTRRKSKPATYAEIKQREADAKERAEEMKRCRNV